MKNNAFDCIRLLAAFAVLLSHSYPLTGHDALEPLTRATGGIICFGELAVAIFFSISGYLVAKSWFDDPSPRRFMVRRILRIFPALAFCIVCSFSLGAAFSDLGTWDYFTRSEAWAFLSKAFIFPAQYALPGVFHENPFPDVVNGSLWSLRLEFALYIFLAAVGLIGLMRFETSCFLALGALAAGIALNKIPELANNPSLHQASVSALNALPFFVGASLAKIKFDQRFYAKIGACIAVAAFPLLLIGLQKFYIVLLLPVVTIVLAESLRCDLRGRDYSYGVYLWAFPVQQACAVLYPTIAPLQMIVIAAPVTLFFAVLSWHFIEHRALALKPRRTPGIKAQVGALAEASRG